MIRILMSYLGPLDNKIMTILFQFVAIILNSISYYIYLSIIIIIITFNYITITNNSLILTTYHGPLEDQVKCMAGRLSFIE